MRLLNLGILAHVDAGKTSLTERLLFDAGVIDSVGRVDDGSTQTDTLELERQRGITIKAAIASFTLGDVAVSLIDTPGHPDFIAEVERALGVLDGAVLVVSAVEGVQAQTRVLMRALRRLQIPTLIFVNKIDRRGADPGRVLRELSERLTPDVLALGTVREAGSAAAAYQPFGPADGDFTRELTDRLTDRDDSLVAAYLTNEHALTFKRLQAALARQSQHALLHPVLFGSAITGAGVAELGRALTELLPCAPAPAFAAGTAATDDAAADGIVFKVERGPAGEKIACLRMFRGSAHVRQVLAYGAGHAGKVTALTVPSAGGDQAAEAVVAGQIARIWGLTGVQVGDRVTAAGSPARAAHDRSHHFPPPALETVIVPARPAERPRLRMALSQLAEQDPLINLRQDDARRELTLSLYGEVQKEVIQATLASEYGLAVSFQPTTTICIERVAGVGSAAESMSDAANPFKATIGLRIESAADGAGVRFELAIERGALPPAFLRAIEETARNVLREGIYGWQVPDCTLTLTGSGYVPPPPQGWSRYSSSAADFRGLTPLVLMAALRRAGTVVCEPVSRFRLEIPAGSLPAVLPALTRLGAASQVPVPGSTACVIDGLLPAARVHDLQQAIAGLTGGEGVLEAEFAGYRQVRGPVPVRSRTDHNPLCREEYLLHVQRGV